MIDRQGENRVTTPTLKFALLGTLLLALIATAHPQAKAKKEEKPLGAETAAKSGKHLYGKYCASCHGIEGKGDGPVATALAPPPPDLTSLTRRHNGKYPAGYVGALLKFGRSFAAHGAEDMPVWAVRFQELDPVHDPTGQQHIDDVVAYVASLQAK